MGVSIAVPKEESVERAKQTNSKNTTWRQNQNHGLKILQSNTNDVSQTNVSHRKNK